MQIYTYNACNTSALEKKCVVVTGVCRVVTDFIYILHDTDCHISLTSKVSILNCFLRKCL